jgi:hypothetical protein
MTGFMWWLAVTEAPIGTAANKVALTSPTNRIYWSRVLLDRPPTDSGFHARHQKPPKIKIRVALGLSKSNYVGLLPIEVHRLFGKLYVIDGSSIQEIWWNARIWNGTASLGVLELRVGISAAGYKRTRP